MGEDVILSMISSQSGQYSLSTDNLIALKQAGASDKVIAAMVNRNANADGMNAVGTRPTNFASAIFRRDDYPTRRHSHKIAIEP